MSESNPTTPEQAAFARQRTLKHYNRQRCALERDLYDFEQKLIHTFKRLTPLEVQSVMRSISLLERSVDALYIEMADAENAPEDTKNVFAAAASDPHPQEEDREMSACCDRPCDDEVVHQPYTGMPYTWIQCNICREWAHRDCIKKNEHEICFMTHNPPWNCRSCSSM
jgi:hypothetical protein